MATESHDYFTVINETKYNFTNNLTVENLTSGTYTICISVSGEVYEQCYTLEVPDGLTVSGKAIISANNASIEITQGTAPYHVFINGIKVLETVSPFFSLDIKFVKSIIAKHKVMQKIESKNWSLILAKLNLHFLLLLLQQVLQMVKLKLLE